MKTQIVMQFHARNMQDDASCYTLKEQKRPDSSVEALRDVKMLQFKSNRVLQSPIFRLLEKTNQLLDVQLPHLSLNCNSSCKCNQHVPNDSCCCHWKNLERDMVEIPAMLQHAPRIFRVKLRQISGRKTWRFTL